MDENFVVEKHLNGISYRYVGKGEIRSNFDSVLDQLNGILPEGYSIVEKSMMVSSATLKDINHCFIGRYGADTNTITIDGYNLSTLDMLAKDVFLISPLEDPEEAIRKHEFKIEEVVVDKGDHREFKLVNDIKIDANSINTVISQIGNIFYNDGNPVSNRPKLYLSYRNYTSIKMALLKYHPSPIYISEITNYYGFDIIKSTSIRDGRFLVLTNK